MLLFIFVVVVLVVLLLFVVVVVFVVVLLLWFFCCDYFAVVVVSRKLSILYRYWLTILVLNHMEASQMFSYVSLAIRCVFLRFYISLPFYPNF